MNIVMTDNQNFYDLPFIKGISNQPFLEAQKQKQKQIDTFLLDLEQSDKAIQLAALARLATFPCSEIRGLKQACIDNETCRQNVIHFLLDDNVDHVKTAIKMFVGFEYSSCLTFDAEFFDKMLMYLNDKDTDFIRDIVSVLRGSDRSFDSYVQSHRNGIAAIESLLIQSNLDILKETVLLTIDLSSFPTSFPIKLTDVSLRNLVHMLGFQNSYLVRGVLDLLNSFVQQNSGKDSMVEMDAAIAGIYTLSRHSCHSLGVAEKAESLLTVLRSNDFENRIDFYLAGLRSMCHIIIADRHASNGFIPILLGQIQVVRDGGHIFLPVDVLTQITAFLPGSDFGYHNQLEASCRFYSFNLNTHHGGMNNNYQAMWDKSDNNRSKRQNFLTAELGHLVPLEFCALKLKADTYRFCVVS